MASHRQAGDIVGNGNARTDPDTEPLMASYETHGSRGPDHDEEATAPQSSIQPGMESATIFEQKCLLINQDIDAMGMGRYQWFVWTLCGFGYMLDLLWAMGFGMVLSPVQQEFGFGNDKTGIISTSFSGGLAAGAFFWGFVADTIGRQWAFNLTVLCTSIFGICLGAPDTYNSFLVLTALTGFGVGGNIPIDTTIVLEFLPQYKRHLLVLLSIWQPLGMVSCAALAYAFIPNYSCSPNFSEANPLPSCYKVEPGIACCRKQDNVGWRYLMYSLGAITLSASLIRTVVFRLKESPKYLVYRCRDQEAIEVLHYVAKYNGVESRLTLEKLQSVERDSDSTSISSKASVEPIDKERYQCSGARSKLKPEFDRYKVLFGSLQMARLTILVWLTYIMDYFGFTVAGTYLPRIIALKNGAINLSLRFTYRSYVYIYLPGVIGVALGSLFYKLPNIGRQWTMVFSSLLMGASIFIFSAVNSAASNIGLNAMEYFFQSMFNAVLYGWTPEVFPASIRGMACGAASFWGRISGIVSPLIAQRLYARSEEGIGDANAVLYLAGGVTLGCVLSVALLPSKSFGNQSL